MAGVLRSAQRHRMHTRNLQRASWLELFKYPRGIAAGALVGLSQTGAVGLGLWMATLLVMVLQVTPAEACKARSRGGLCLFLGNWLQRLTTSALAARTAKPAPGRAYVNILLPRL